MEKITRLNADFQEVVEGSSGAGLYLSVSLDKLIEKLGPPSSVGSGDNKIQLEWVYYKSVSDPVKGNSYKCFRIYDYKTRCPIHRIYSWNIGSKGMSPIQIIKELKKLGFQDDEIIHDD